MWKCKHCGNQFDFITTSEKGNHSRWCKKNPKNEDFRSSNSYRAAQRIVDVYGEYTEYEVVCGTCFKLHIVVERDKLFPSKNVYFCCRKCANSVGGKAKVEKYGRTKYQSIAKNNLHQSCVVCGFSDVVDIHHIDCDRSNDSLDNLMVLCPNHHAMVHRLGFCVEKYRGRSFKW